MIFHKWISQFRREKTKGKSNLTLITREHDLREILNLAKGSNNWFFGLWKDVKFASKQKNLAKN